MAEWVVAALLLVGCRGGEENNSAAATPSEPTNAAVAEAKLKEEVAVVETAGLLPPDATLVSREPVEGAIAFDFRAATPPERLVQWYRTASPGFQVTSEMEEGSERVLSGTTRRPAGDFSVRLAPDRSGGTTAMVLVTLRR
jgi:hypothetical protein